MSKTTALLTVLALGASASVAMASPSRSYAPTTGARYAALDHSRSARNVDQDRFGRLDRDRGWTTSGTGDDSGPRRYRPTWTALGAPLQLTRTGNQSVEVNDRGTFTQLRLMDIGGTARLDRLVIKFADGSTQVEDLRHVLDHNQDYLEVTLDGNNRQIDCITVLGTSGGRSNLQVYAI